MYSLDQLRPDRRVFWTVQPRIDIAEAIEARNNMVTIAQEIERLLDAGQDDDGTDHTEEQADTLRDQHLSLSVEIYEIEQQVADHHLTIQIRVSIRGYSSLALSEHHTLSAEARSFYEERTGERMEDLSSGEPDPAKTELATACISWARAIPAIVRVEIRPISLYLTEPEDYAGDLEWHAETVPAAWLSVEGALNEIPAMLLRRLATETRIANNDTIYPLHVPAPAEKKRKSKKTASAGAEKKL